MVDVKGGDKLSLYLKTMTAAVNKAARVEVGFPAGSTERDGASTPMIAAIQEYGAPAAGIPPRPFFRTMIEQKSPEWPGQIAEALKANNFDSARTLDQVGQVIAAELADSIINLTSPPLSPVTIMLRGMRTQNKYQNMGFWARFAEAKARVAAGKSNYGASTKPLIDHGDLIGNIKSTVITD